MLLYVYASNEVCETEENVMFYAKLDSVLDQCPRRDALIVLATLMLSLAPKGLAMKYVLVPIVLVPEMTTALSF